MSRPLGRLASLPNIFADFLFRFTKAWHIKWDGVDWDTGIQLVLSTHAEAESCQGRWQRQLWNRDCRDKIHLPFLIQPDTTIYYDFMCEISSNAMRSDLCDSTESYGV